jgi:hypothetical protein
LFGPNDRNDTPDLVQGHAIHGFTGDPSGHRTRIGVQPLIGQQIQPWIEQQSIQPFHRQTTPAAFT